MHVKREQEDTGSHPAGTRTGDALLNEIRWLSGLMAEFARYGEEDFDAVERILSLERD